ncbi:hypothetical protein HDU98_011821 [Podochytrium sp. JEL0797]|nr:hypothetical protein HDU98_011821 [Podochytrium sp. JEL0797]
MAPIPIEVWPIVGMIATALTFGVYVTHKKITTGEDLRLGSRVYDEHHWAHRLATDMGKEETAEKKTFGNFFYKHIKD